MNRDQRHSVSVMHSEVSLCLIVEKLPEELLQREMRAICNSSTSSPLYYKYVSSCHTQFALGINSASTMKTLVERRHFNKALIWDLWDDHNQTIKAWKLLHKPPHFGLLSYNGGSCYYSTWAWSVYFISPSDPIHVRRPDAALHHTSLSTKSGSGYLSGYTPVPSLLTLKAEQKPKSPAPAHWSLLLLLLLRR